MIVLIYLSENLTIEKHVTIGFMKRKMLIKEREEDI